MYADSENVVQLARPRDYTRPNETSGEGLLACASKKLPRCIQLIALLSLVTACGLVPSPTPTATAVPTPVAVTVRQLIDSGERFVGHPVTMTGTVILECTSGCWFFLDDGTGKIYIDLATAGLHIPQKVGRRVTLRGDIVGAGGNLHIAAEEVTFPE